MIHVYKQKRDRSSICPSKFTVSTVNVRRQTAASILYRSRKTAAGGTPTTAEAASAIARSAGGEGGHQLLGLFAAAFFAFNRFGLRGKN